MRIRKSSSFTERQEKIYKALKEHPESTPFQIAKIVGVKTSTVLGSLYALETHGILLCEDLDGRISIFKELD